MHLQYPSPKTVLMRSLLLIGQSYRVYAVTWCPRCDFHSNRCEIIATSTVRHVGVPLVTTRPQRNTALAQYSYVISLQTHIYPSNLHQSQPWYFASWLAVEIRMEERTRTEKRLDFSASLEWYNTRESSWKNRVQLVGDCGYLLSVGLIWLRKN